jgi:hypothetical protein
MTGTINRAELTLEPQELKEILEIMKQHVPKYAVWVFGSRA